MDARRSSSVSYDNGQAISKVSARDSSFWMAPTLMLVLICRIESLAASRRRSTSLNLDIGVVYAGMALIPQKKESE